MISLPNGCTCSNLTVTPKNWKNCKASALARNWHIQYYFYDTNKKQRKFVLVKGMNRFKTLIERREATQQLIENELYNLKDKGYNPISGKFINEPQSFIEPKTPFIEALRRAYDLLKLEPTTMQDIHSNISFFELSAKKMGIDKLEVYLVRRKHLKQMLEFCGHFKKSWSSYGFNNCRGYLMMLYKILLEHDAIETNPVKEIAKQKTVKKLREILSSEERVTIDNHLKTADPDFRRAIHIFFHSGSRRTELTNLKCCDVDLGKQTIKLLIKKGNHQQESLRAIKNIALSYWKEQLQNCRPEDYVFSENFKPGKTKMRPERFTKKWLKHVKKELGINIDFYALKHLNLDEIATILDINAAAKAAGHTSPVITMKHYAVNEKEREMKKIKEVDNKFA